ncbi:hypothetical protein EV651_11216 [Kribbella sp. VKM Ac-2571]|uniref:hypothetical protein n=1 Tax=Kribbella sp. VKM Ac-2571 TaxID=2512222 RepID=UPI001061223C|nr:hypothetical protein [Kribbella sp. VKM Ac-2571]TDO56629.1 hypothetical protein EV651_11216 [Kribbella sp. VKM Ac-2571]
MCGPADLNCHVVHGFSEVIGDAFDKVAQMIGDGAMEAMNGVATIWIDQPTPEVVNNASGAHPTNTAIVNFLQGNVLWISASIFTMAVLVAAIRTAWEQRAQPLQDLLKAVLIFVAVSAAGTATLQLLVESSDLLAEHIIKSVHPDNSTLGRELGTLIIRAGLSPVTFDHAASLVVMLAGVFAILAGLVQVVLMLIRSAMLILLAGTFPLAAAATNTEIGQNWFQKYCGWTLAFVAYKPAAALIYAAAMKMNEDGFGGSGNGFVQTATGMMMLMLAIFALPALLRFMVPLTSAVAAGSAGMGMAAAGAGGLATGAVNVGRAAFGGGFGGSGGGAPSAGSASGAVGVGPIGIGLAAAGAAVNGSQKVAEGVAGAAAPSTGETGGGSVTPATSFGPMPSGGSRSSGTSSSAQTSSARVSQEPEGPSGNWW